MKLDTKAIVAERLDMLMSETPALDSQVKLAKKTGIGQTTIGRIRRGEVNATADNLQAIADAFGVPVGFLYGDELRVKIFNATSPAVFPAYDSRVKELLAQRGMKVEEQQGTYSADSNVAEAATKGKLPLISWVQAGEWSEIVDNFQPGDADEWIPCPFTHTESAFILQVVGWSMHNPTGDKSYSPGEFIAVDPGREPRHKSMVIAKVDGEEKATFKQLLIDPEGAMMLKALNPDHRPNLMELPKNSRIVGVVIGKWTPE